ncbi:protein-glutamate O-methyltransferase CheR [Roseomonas frigidaquae]|uniref:Chemotaxis protein methyltransferase n=1 Tax=Falsiroseomonas frigidaquae TaxID=487318 RepID=A0ABX1F1T3_9PROT|nr:protein-glutamate O-methyltransferase CheR [Falsiroseomonas frigidaquae]NKE46300.1 protein-glutamate O-methyltransferase CheR [Falsiroseomonas frigidaquae]
MPPLSATATGSRAALDAAGITESDYLRFCEYFYRRTGIAFGDNKRYFVDKRLIERMHATGHGSFEPYFLSLRRFDAQAEIERLTNLLTVNETYFYREDHQFHCLSASILPEVTAGRRHGDRVRIWSMPCSTGEEPYSIAIHLLENWARVDDFNIEIIASDIDTKVLRSAAEGLYDARSLHRLPRDLVRRYFVTEGADRFRLIDAIRQSVSFTTLNASDPAAMRAYAGVDVIFCRNMLIYFDDKSRKQVVESFYDSLTEGGFICLGHSESMSRISPIFKARAFAQAIVYQKPGGPR